ncbi:hypothetical protein LU293_06320 [Moraxella nasovis]|uniref:hypothetical protein n=1 Tax=Moraxella nasovis TaxID=2904121 RepID=UPI001F6142E8|nr:hypothetical protein [Moraxella nasovis]UNU72729.1 hypothetical protein LU293_06320 [Moraxella nasovis]
MAVISMTRPSWRGIFAGLLMGLVVIIAMAALALVLGSFLSLDLQGAGITAGIYTIITALLSAFVAGYFAVKASAPESILGDGTAIHPKDATLTGVLTAAVIIVATSYFAMSGATSIVRGAGNAVGSIASGAGSAVSSVTGAAASAAGTGAAASGLLANSEIANKARTAYESVKGDVSREDIEAILAKNLDGIDQAQISATATVVQNLLKDTKEEVQSLDFTSIDTWKNLDEHAKARMAHIEGVLASDEFINRLQAQGLSRAQAEQVRTEATQTYQEYKAKTEKTIEETRQDIEQGLAQAEDHARKAALYGGLFWLISALLTFIASIAGARSAAANYRRLR